MITKTKTKWTTFINLFVIKLLIQDECNYREWSRTWSWISTHIFICLKYCFFLITESAISDSFTKDVNAKYCFFYYLCILSWSILLKPSGESESCSLTATTSLVSSNSFKTATADSISTATHSSSWLKPALFWGTNHPNDSSQNQVNL